ncbi:MAG TPA: PIN domain-containing protein [Acidimicrobiales bacterium]|nr:PIN domain-containing protein [Acidimicrobiales bacterium]
MTPPHAIVVVDTNAIAHGAWRLDSPAWKVLLHQARSAQIRLVVPELVVRETVGRFKAELEIRRATAASGARKFNELTGGEGAPISSAPLREIVDSYESTLRSRLLDFRVHVAEFPDVDIDDLVNRAIERRRPFNEKGSGFRDALLWETVLALVEANPNSPVLLISNDAQAFAEPGGEGNLHPELRAELGERGLRATFDLVGSVSAYLDGLGIVSSALVARVFEDASEQQAELVNLAAADLHGGELVSGSPHIQALIRDVEDVRVVIGGASGASGVGALALAHFTVEAQARVQLRVHDDATPIVREVQTSLHVPGTATYDSTERSFSDLQLELPPVADLPALVGELRELDPSQFPRSPFPPEFWEQLRRASQVQFPPEFLEQLRRAWTIWPRSFSDPVEREDEEPDKEDEGDE